VISSPTYYIYFTRTKPQISTEIKISADLSIYNQINQAMTRTSLYCGATVVLWFILCPDDFHIINTIIDVLRNIVAEVMNINK